MAKRAPKAITHSSIDVCRLMVARERIVCVSSAVAKAVSRCTSTSKQQGYNEDEDWEAVGCVLALYS